LTGASREDDCRRRPDCQAIVLRLGSQPVPTDACGHSGFSERIVMTSVLIGVLITFLVVILVLYLINMLPIDGRAKQIARVIVIVIGVISLLRYLQVF
jgi:hypothetical protein